jgi:hypothetical protein
LTGTFINSNDSTSVLGNISFDLSSSKPDVGTRSYNWTFTPNNTTNYNIQTGSTSVTINPLPLTSFSYTPSSLTTTFGVSGESITPQINITGGIINYDISGVKPTGISIDTLTGQIRWSDIVPNNTYTLIVKAFNPYDITDMLITQYILTVNNNIIPPSNFNYNPNTIDISFGDTGSSNIPSIITGGGNIVYELSGSITGIYIDVNSGIIGWGANLSVNSYNITARARNSAGSITTQLLLNVNPLIPSGLSYINTNIIGYNGFSGNSSIATINNGGEPLTFDISESIPSDIYINRTNGQISWNNNVNPAQYNFIVKASNRRGTTILQFSLLIKPRPTTPVITYNNTNINYGNTNTVTPNINDGGAPVTYSIIGYAPSGITINSNTGILNVSQLVNAGTYNIQVSATNIAGTSQIVIPIIIDSVAPSLFSYSSNNIIVVEGVQYISPIPNINTGGETVTYTILTPFTGISIDANTGVFTISSNVQIQTYNIQIRASNSKGYIDEIIIIDVIQKSNNNYGTNKASIYLPHLYNINDSTILLNGNNNNQADYYIEQEISSVYVSASLLINILQYNGDINDVDNFTINELPQNNNTSLITLIKNTINQIILNCKFEYALGDNTYGVSKYSFLSDKFSKHVLQYVLSVLFGIPNVQIPTVDDNEIYNDISNFNIGNKIITDFNDLDTRKFILKQLADNNIERFNNTTNQLRNFPLQKGDEFSFTITTGFEIINQSEYNTFKNRLVYDMTRLFNTIDELDINTISNKISIEPIKWSIKLILED